ncbi:molybdopterin molybdotransferase MoeA [Helicobacter sp. MIT 14-3879]|uniref:molybdopterin molybdotransferase MoeA n=1 Tax=Helicobacter sp. MIT 14-3879 TaxID=2040649 RepID=UPI000E1F33B3|nr:molybdopterin molybdotransferase MoeA [Helicobacter sp. MIT 14-3879]RDU63522.1 hypothetical protein CQA44_05410 [Helicobacter sp. MIT 14-3879]
MQDLREYLKKIYSLKVKQVDSKSIKLHKSLNRILDSDITCKIDIPRFNTSAMDGYVIKLGYENYEIKGNIFAGEKNSIVLENNFAYKIMTGAKIPLNTDSVIQKELVEIKDNKLILKTNPKKDNCIKFRGEDFKKNDILVRSGKVITPNIIGILASQGIDKVKVKKKVKIIIFGSGNEVVNIDSKPNEFQIYDINSYFIKSVFCNLNCSIHYGGILDDNINKIKKAIKKAIKKYDIIITSGGVSVGDKDYIHSVLGRLDAEILADSINIKPGRPVLLSRIEDSFILSLPGNPIGAFLQASFCLPPLIQKFSSLNYYLGAKVAINEEEFRVSKNTYHIILGNLLNNRFIAYNNAKYQGSQIAPLLKSNAMAIFYNKEVVKKGDNILVLSFNPYFVNNLDRMFNIVN